MKSWITRSLKCRACPSSLKTLPTTLTQLICQERILTRRLFLPRFMSLRKDLTTRRRLSWRRSSSLRKSPTWPKNCARKPSMVVRPHSRLPRRLMSTRLALLIFPARCSPLYPSYPCSNPRLSSYSKRRRRRTPFWRRVFRTWTKECHQQRTPKWSGNACSATQCADVKRVKSVANVKHLRLNLPLQVSRRQPCPVLTVICLPTSRSQDHTVSLPHTSRASLARRCVISSSPRSRRSSTEKVLVANL